LTPVANLPPVSTTPAVPVANLPPVLLIPVALIPVSLTPVETGAAPGLANIPANFGKHLK
jgi:hypothetical protein